MVSFPCNFPCVAFSSAALNGHNTGAVGSVWVPSTRGCCVAGSREPKGLNAVKLFLSFLGTWQWLSFSCFVAGGTIPEFSLGLYWRRGRIQVIVSEAAVALGQYQRLLHPLAEKKGTVNKASLR